MKKVLLSLLDLPKIIVGIVVLSCLNVALTTSTAVKMVAAKTVITCCMLITETMRLFQLAWYFRLVKSFVSCQWKRYHVAWLMCHLHLVGILFLIFHFYSRLFIRRDEIGYLNGGFISKISRASLQRYMILNYKVIFTFVQNSNNILNTTSFLVCLFFFTILAFITSERGDVHVVPAGDESSDEEGGRFIIDGPKIPMSPPLSPSALSRWSEVNIYD